MAVEKRTLHQRLQEYCECFMETDPKRELERIGKWGTAADVTGDPEEVGIRFLGLAILYGLKENAEKISISREPGAGTQMTVEAAGKYKLPAPEPEVAEQALKVMRSITHLEAANAREPLAFGIKNDRLEFGIEFHSADGKETMSISFPRL
jgi:hypothetical protein